ncbi:MAG: hypothetical protein WD826_12145, partial [Actinomycetota bacterium]
MTMILGLALVGVGVGITIANRPPNLRTDSEEIGDRPFEHAARARDAYRITYRVEIVRDEEVATSTDAVSVRRPFDALVRSRAGGNDLGDIEAGFGRYAVNDQVFAAQPGVPEPDRRPDAVLAEAVRDGYAEERELRRVVDRDCRIYRLGAGSDNVSLPKLVASKDRVDICVDEAGLILEEVTYADGEAKGFTRRRLATRVEVEPRFPKDEFEIAELQGDARTVGSFKQLEDDSKLPGQEFWELADPPEGFEFVGRYAIVPPGQAGFSDPTARGSIVAFSSEAWRDGIDVFVIDQGAAQSAKPFADDPDARSVTAGELKDGELRYSLRESEVRFLTGGSRFVRIRGTLAPSRLLAIARSLESTPGGP